MKRPRRFVLLGLLLVVALTLIACGNSGGSVQDTGRSDEDASAARQANPGRADGEMSGMDMGETTDEQGLGEAGSMDHGSYPGSGEMDQPLVAPNGEYSDEAFIDSMVPHHRSAMDMAEVALDNAEHAEVRRLAEGIVAAQGDEIEQLRSIKERESGTSEVPMEMNAEEMESMGMMEDPQQLAKEEPFDKAFIDAMIPHHRSAIEMANVALEESENEEIQALASDIVDAQTREIRQMEQWRQRWYPNAEN